MANLCALCGKQMSFFGGKPLVCANQDEVFCSGCYDVLYPLDNLERGRYLLTKGKPEHPEEMQKFISVWEERTKQTQTFQPTERPCPNCEAMMERKLKDFRIGSYGDSLAGQGYDVDLYACPECGKVELYTANFASIKRREARQAAEKAARQAAQEEKLAKRQQEQVSRSGGKPPWER